MKWNGCPPTLGHANAWNPIAATLINLFQPLVNSLKTQWLIRSLSKVHINSSSKAKHLDSTLILLRTIMIKVAVNPHHYPWPSSSPQKIRNYIRLWLMMLSMYLSGSVFGHSLWILRRELIGSYFPRWIKDLVKEHLELLKIDIFFIDTLWCNLDYRSFLFLLWLFLDFDLWLSWWFNLNLFLHLDLRLGWWLHLDLILRLLLDLWFLFD